MMKITYRLLLSIALYAVPQIAQASTFSAEDLAGFTKDASYGLAMISFEEQQPSCEPDVAGCVDPLPEFVAYGSATDSTSEQSETYTSSLGSEFQARFDVDNSIGAAVSRSNDESNPLYSISTVTQYDVISLQDGASTSLVAPFELAVDGILSADLNTEAWLQFDVYLYDITDTSGALLSEVTTDAGWTYLAKNFTVNSSMFQSAGDFAELGAFEAATYDQPVNLSVPGEFTLEVGHQYLLQLNLTASLMNYGGEVNALNSLSFNFVGADSLQIATATGADYGAEAVRSGSQDGQLSAVPLPAGLPLTASGLALLGLLRSRRRKA